VVTTALISQEPDDTIYVHRAKRQRTTKLQVVMAPSITTDKYLSLWRPRDMEEIDQLDNSKQSCAGCRASAMESVVNEEEICLCPKQGVDSGQVTRGGVRVRASKKKLFPSLARRVGPVLAMALLCVTLWSSVHWRFPRPKLQPGVRDDAYVAPATRPPSRLGKLLTGTKYHRPTARSHVSLPSLPEFSLEPLQLQIDAQTERVMDIYCRGALLHAVQMAGVFPDSKHFVDMPLKSNTTPFQVLLDFQESKLSMTEFHTRDDELGVPHDTQLRAFLDAHFDPPGADFAPITPFDFQEHTTPPMIAAIQRAELKEWALSLHKLWRQLGRIPQAHVTSSFLHAKALDDPHLHRKQNVLIVPGGRFRESYYWDSYWIVQGLLVSDMRVTARGIVNNLLEYVAEFGFVPNGGRIYYLTRSQPPLLSDMVKLVAQTGRKNASCVEYKASYLKSVLPILEQEYTFWMQRGPGGHAVEIVRKRVTNGTDATDTYVLNRFVSNANHPRPESYREDVVIAAEIYGDTIHADHGQARETEANKARYYNDVIAAAESGWDFSSRWLRDPFDMRSMFTSCIVPVDLNAVMYRMERNLMTFHRYLGGHKRALFFERQAENRRLAMDAVLWNSTLGTWKDYNLENYLHSEATSVSDYAPLWAKAFDPDDTERLDRVVVSLRTSGLIQSGGVQTTAKFTGQQWDAPNAWPPEQDILIEGLLAANTRESHELARELAKTWVHTSLTAWRDTGLMFEKYNATEVGGLGVGGEYFPQFGFGWTNGVVLKFLTIHQNLLDT
jgi:alpha,alpha-trehalase